MSRGELVSLLNERLEEAVALQVCDASSRERQEHI